MSWSSFISWYFFPLTDMYIGLRTFEQKSIAFHLSVNHSVSLSKIFPLFERPRPTLIITNFFIANIVICFLITMQRYECFFKNANFYLLFLKKLMESLSKDKKR